jgi:sec-independent protein translocase protein TatA
MGLEAPWHWVVLAIIVIALFGYKKLPDAARSLGRSLRIFKTEIKGMGDDDAARAAKKAEVVPPAVESRAAEAPTTDTDAPSTPPAPATSAAKNDSPGSDGA